MKRFLGKISAKILKLWSKWEAIAITAPSIAVIVIGINNLGLLQILEWAAYDQLFRVRPIEKIDKRIVIVTIDESDLTSLKEWPLSDQTIATAINIIKAQKPRIIALDIYRDLVVEPGHEKLVEVFESTPNLIGVEKVSGKPVAPSPILKKKGQVSLADLVIDSDSKVRRALLSVRRKDGTIQMSLGTDVALRYLDAEGINLKPVSEKNTLKLQLGMVKFQPLDKYYGAYVNADNGGYQILLNYRGLKDKFLTISLSDLLNDNFNPNLMKDRIVFIGSVAESLNDKFYTPFSSLLTYYPLRTGGVVIHANITSQIISSALDGRPLIRSFSNQVEWLWIFVWSLIGAIISWLLVANCSPEKNIYQFIFLLLVSMTIPGLVLLTISYHLFLNGWWILIISPLFALCLSALSVTSYQNFTWQKIASTDSLTSLHNRRYFDLHLSKLWEQHKQKKKPLSVILCDVDFFKAYNDCYGHMAGDKCLQYVSQGIVDAVRNTDLVVRYGGEEFAIILPNTNPAIADKVAQRICAQIESLQIEHQESKINQWVTVSCGSASMVPDPDFSTYNLVNQADQALYKAKAEGRNCSRSGMLP
ncbi:MAG TPA: diguanylate cyclase [Cyanothece sp. UBA12306]|nr:diguanylate cyclase [Cyanothece sp. UBA12306]